MEAKGAQRARVTLSKGVMLVALKCLTVTYAIEL